MKKETHNLIEVVEFCRKNGLADCAEIVGRWVWLTFGEKPSESVRQTIKEYGFRWVHRRGRWAHNCGHYSRQDKGDPKRKYGAIRVSDYDE